MFRVGETVGVVKLKNAYDDHALSILGERLQRLDQERQGGKKRPPAKYKVVKALPSKDEYNTLKVQRYTQSADSLADSAFSEVETLAEEMRSWYDNLTEGLQQTDRGNRVSEAADALENISRVDAPDAASHIDVYYPPSLDSTSRSKRASEAADMLNSVASAVREWIEENRPEGDPSSSSVKLDGEEEEVTVDWNDLESFADDCENAASEVEGVEFPGMYD